MRSTFWGASEQLSFEEYVRSTTNLPACNIIVNSVKQSEESKQGKDVCLQRMFQNGRDASSAFIYAHHARLQAKKNRLVSYKFSQGRQFQLEQKRRNKTPDDLVIRTRRLGAYSLNKQLRLEIPGTASTAISGHWRKIFQIAPVQNMTNDELMVNAEAVNWEEKKTTSLSDASYCKLEKCRPNIVSQISRFRQKREREQERYHCTEEKRQERKTVSPSKHSPRSPNVSPKAISKPKLAPPINPPKRNIRPRLTQVLKIESQTKIQCCALDQTDEMEQTICFLKDPELMDLSQPLFNEFQARQSIAGQAFSMVQVLNGQPKLLFEHQADNRMQIASLTKTMTCLLVLLMTEKFKIDTVNTYVKVNEKASRLMGTTAGLLYADYVKLGDILYGLMLPSGNDAALALAEWGGNVIRNYCSKRNNGMSTSNSKQRSLVYSSTKGRSAIGLFVFHMNALARTLCMENTKFSNAHGLMNKKSFSCSRDQAKLCLFAMKRQDFRRVVNCKEYKCTIPNKMFANERQVVWQNTNRLLESEGFCGVKTGITPTAGPCLASCYRVTESEYIYIVLLKTKSLSHRFEQSKKLLVEVIRLLHCRSGRKQYAAALARLNAQPSPESIDLEDRNELEDDDNAD